MNARRVFQLLFALISAAMLGLAAGAVWMLPTVYLQHRLPWLALPIGWLLAVGIRRWIRPPGQTAATLAAIATLLAAGYVSLLTAATQIAGMLGIGLTDAMHTAGLGMLLWVSRFAASPASIGYALIGAAIAAWTASRRHGRAGDRAGVARSSAPIDPAP